MTRRAYPAVDSAGRAWLVRRTLFGGWAWAAHLVGSAYDAPSVYADSLRACRARVACVAPESGA